jgi:hypothetical protein
MKNAPKKVFSELGTYCSIGAFVASRDTGKRLKALGSRYFTPGFRKSVLHCSGAKLLRASRSREGSVYALFPKKFPKIKNLIMIKGKSCCADQKFYGTFD